MNINSKKLEKNVNRMKNSLDDKQVLLFPKKFFEKIKKYIKQDKSTVDWIIEACNEKIQKDSFDKKCQKNGIELKYEDEKLYDNAIKTFGEEAQFKKAIEETTELSLALIQYTNGKMTIKDVISEIADMKIIIDQLIYMYDETGEVEDEIDLKKYKLRKIIEKANK